MRVKKTKHEIFMLIREQYVNSKRLLKKINVEWRENHDFLEETCNEEMNEIRNFLKANESYVKKIQKLDSLLYEKDWAGEHSTRLCVSYECRECELGVGNDKR